MPGKLFTPSFRKYSPSPDTLSRSLQGSDQTTNGVSAAILGLGLLSLDFIRTFSFDIKTREMRCCVYGEVVLEWKIIHHRQGRVNLFFFFSRLESKDLVAHTEVWSGIQHIWSHLALQDLEVFLLYTFNIHRIFGGNIILYLLRQ